MDLMAAVAVGAGWALVLGAWRRGDYLAPGVVFALASLATLTVFVVIAMWGAVPAWASHFWQVRSDYRGVAPSVVAFYFGLIVLGLAAHRAGLSGAGGPREAATQAVADPLGQGVRSRLALFLTLFTVWLVALHATVVGLQPILFYTKYLAIREPAAVGIDDPLLGIVHRNLPLLGALGAVVTTVAWERRATLYVFLLAPATAWAMLVTIGFGSRFIVLQLALVAVTWGVLKGRWISPFTVLVGSVAMVVYAGLLMLRRATSSGRIGSFGLAPLLNALGSVPAVLGTVAAFAGFNFFGGGFLMASAFERGSATQPLRYKLLSYSPLPSAMDGFNAVRDFQVKAAFHSPYSNFAEAFLFGLPFLLLLLGGLFVVLVLLTRYWKRLPPVAGLVLLTPAYYALLKMHMYPLRHTVRWLVIAVLMCWAAERWRQSRVSGSAQAVEAGAT